MNTHLTSILKRSFIHFADGLKDNPLYGTASTCNDTSGPIYSQVKKSYEIEEDHEDAVDIGTVYSQVQKKTSRGTPYYI